MVETKKKKRKKKRMAGENEDNFDANGKNGAKKKWQHISNRN